MCWGGFGEGPRAAVSPLERKRKKFLKAGLRLLVKHQLQLRVLVGPLGVSVASVHLSGHPQGSCVLSRALGASQGF
eukprot:2156199-Alexandrium_andersonii.AAC.1